MWRSTCSFCSVGEWEQRALLNAANTGAILDCEPHVAVLAPARTPRVLHDPVLTSSLTSVANDEGSVVEISSAPGTVEDPTTILLEDPLVSLDQDRGGLLRDSGLHLGDVVRSHV